VLPERQYENRLTADHKSYENGLKREEDEMLKNMLKIGGILMAVGLLSVPAWSAVAGNTAADRVVVAHNGNGPGDGSGNGGVGPGDGSGNGPGTGDCLGQLNIDNEMLLARGGAGGPGAGPGSGDCDGTGGGAACFGWAIPSSSRASATAWMTRFCIRWPWGERGSWSPSLRSAGTSSNSPLFRVSWV